MVSTPESEPRGVGPTAHYVQSIGKTTSHPRVTGLLGFCLTACPANEQGYSVGFSACIDADRFEDVSPLDPAGAVDVSIVLEEGVH